MAKTKPTDKEITKIAKYIKAKGTGMTKGEAMRFAGYSDKSSRLPHKVEQRQGYQIALQQITKQNAETIDNVSQQLAKRVLSGELNLTSMKDHADILTKLVKVHETLNPKIKVEQDSDGNTKATKWQTINN